MMFLPRERRKVSSYEGKYIYICIYIFILFVKFIGEGKIVSSLKFDPPLEIVVDYFRGA